MGASQKFETRYNTIESFCLLGYRAHPFVRVCHPSRRASSSVCNSMFDHCVGSVLVCAIDVCMKRHLQKSGHWMILSNFHFSFAFEIAEREMRRLCMKHRVGCFCDVIRSCFVESPSDAFGSRTGGDDDRRIDDERRLISDLF